MSSASKTGIAVLGAGGFIGRRVAESLSSGPDDVTLRLMVRSGKLTSDLPSATVLPGDIRDLDSTRAAIRGTRAVVHAASYVGYDPELCRSTNVDGTRNLVEAAKAEGVARIVYVSTASVYGGGPFRGEAEEQLSIAPQSVLSQSRSDAERVVLDAGGVVLRPDMVFGAGDRWFVPGLVRFVQALGGIVDGGAARMSMIHVADLAALASRFALAHGQISGPFNAAYSQPNSVSDMLDLLRPLDAWTAPLVSLTRAEGAAMATSHGFTERQFELLTDDHWFDASAVEAAVGSGWVSGFRFGPADLDWYRSLVAAQ